MYENMMNFDDVMLSEVRYIRTNLHYSSYMTLTRVVKIIDAEHRMDISRG